MRHISQQRRHYCPPSVSPWLLQPRHSSARPVTARAPSGPSTPTPCTRDFTVSLEKKHPSAPSQTGSNPSPLVAAMGMHSMNHRGENPLEDVKCFIGYQSDRESIGGYPGDQQYQTPQRGNQGDWVLGDDIQACGSGVGVVRAMGNSYCLSADVSGFEPHEVVVVAYNQHVVIYAEKIGADGSVAGKFTHKSVLPADMDPLSVSSELTAERMLLISIGRIHDPGHPS
ncbi:uncharacterized protein hspb12 isoform X2 [Pseudorasbora parva]|uniref:uncharacterized protein hspb12 isoform X2 n=1 Tax=Pseudorasbora parva TaxID=51549 RepID=UPI00351DC3C7